MNRTISVRPPRTSSVVMIGMGLLFLFFGIAFIAAAEGEARPFVLVFGILWIAVCIGFIVFGIYSLSRGKAPAVAIIDVESSPEEGADFEAKLRKLERLRKERLISEEEYRRKRTEIMAEKW